VLCQRPEETIPPAFEVKVKLLSASGVWFSPRASRLFCAGNAPDYKTGDSLQAQIVFLPKRAGLPPWPLFDYNKYATRHVSPVENTRRNHLRGGWEREG
jgi:hypothetical protein